MAPIIPLLGALAAAAGTAGTAAGVTGTVLGVSASTIASVASAVGTVLGIAGTAQQAGAAAKQQEKQAAAIEKQGIDQALSSSIDAENLRRQNRLRQSAARAQLAESGGLSGTAFGLLSQNAVAGELDALTLAFNGQRQQGRAFEQGADLRSSARSTRQGGLLSAGAQLVGGVGTLAARGVTEDPLNVEDRFGPVAGVPR